MRIILFITLCTTYLSVNALDFDRGRFTSIELSEDESAVYQIWFQNYACFEMVVKKDRELVTTYGASFFRSYFYKFPINLFRYNTLQWYWKKWRFQPFYSESIYELIDSTITASSSEKTIRNDSTIFFRLVKKTIDSTIISFKHINLADSSPNNFLTVLNQLDAYFNLEHQLVRFIKSLPAGSYSTGGTFYFLKRSKLRNHKVDVPCFNEKYLKEVDLLPVRYKVKEVEKFKEKD